MIPDTYKMAMLCLMLSACSGNKRSERDIAREQMRINAEAKRQELSQVSGTYSGNLSLDQGEKRAATLFLAVKDVPQTNESGVDAELVPQLTGYISVGKTAFNPPVRFSVTRAEYDATSGHLDILTGNSKLNSVKIDLTRSNSQLVGTWISAEASQSGSIELGRAEDLEALSPSEMKTSLFSGKFTKDNELFRNADLQLVYTAENPDTFRTDGILRVFAGDPQSDEYELFKFEDMVLNPFQMTIQGTNEGLSIQGHIDENRFSGNWASPARGVEGQIDLTPVPSGDQRGGTL